MTTDPFVILFACAHCCAVFLLLGILMCFMALRRVRDDFRDKGYLQVPSGWEFFHFLERQHYDRFDDIVARTYFSICRICAMAIIAIIAVGGLVLGTVLMMTILYQPTLPPPYVSAD